MTEAAPTPVTLPILTSASVTEKLGHTASTPWTPPPADVNSTLNLTSTELEDPSAVTISGVVGPGSLGLFGPEIPAGWQDTAKASLGVAHARASALVPPAERPLHLGEWHEGLVRGLTEAGWSPYGSSSVEQRVFAENAQFHKVLAQVVAAVGLHGTAEAYLMGLLQRLEPLADDDGMIPFLTWKRVPGTHLTASFSSFLRAGDSLTQLIVTFDALFDALDSVFMGILHYKNYSFELRYRQAVLMLGPRDLKPSTASPTALMQLASANVLEPFQLVSVTPVPHPPDSKGAKVP